MYKTLLDVTKYSALAIALGIAAGCASTSELKRVEGIATQAQADAQAAGQAANQASQAAADASRKADSALQAADEANACCQKTNGPCTSKAGREKPSIARSAPLWRLRVFAAPRWWSLPR